MDWLKAVIARLLGRPTQQVSNTALPTLPVGPAHPEPTTLAGSLCSAQDMSPPLQPPQPASPAPSQLKVAAQRTAAEPSSTPEQAPVQTPTVSPSGAHGKRKAPARQTRQRASQASKAKQKPASPTKAVAKPTRAKAPAKTRTVRRSGDNGN